MYIPLLKNNNEIKKSSYLQITETIEYLDEMKFKFENDDFDIYLTLSSDFYQKKINSMSIVFEISHNSFFDRKPKDLTMSFNYLGDFEILTTIKKPERFKKDLKELKNNIDKVKDNFKKEVFKNNDLRNSLINICNIFIKEINKDLDIEMEDAEIDAFICDNEDIVKEIVRRAKNGELDE